MKKLYTTRKYKARNSKKIKTEGKRRKRRKGKKRVKKNPYLIVRNGHQTQIENVVAPPIFSLVSNPEAVLKYFEKAKKYLKKGKVINLDISEIESLTPDAIALQISKINDVRFHNNVQIFGNAPKIYYLRNLFSQSGFYEYVRTRGPKPTNQNKLLIHKITDNKVEPRIAKEACLVGLRHAFKNEEIFEPLYNILIEIMQNTNNHAGSTKGKYDWWLHVLNDPNSNISTYTFLDLGIGVFESAPVQSFKQSLLQMIGLKSKNVDLVEKLFKGEIKSRTGRPDRGKGLPQVMECSQDAAFSKFVLISNDIYANLKTQEWFEMNKSFEGTLYYWELINPNEK